MEGLQRKAIAVYLTSHARNEKGNFCMLDDASNRSMAAYMRPILLPHILKFRVIEQSLPVFIFCSLSRNLKLTVARQLFFGWIVLICNVLLLSDAHAQSFSVADTIVNNRSHAYFSYSIDHQPTATRVLFVADKTLRNVDIVRYKWRFGDGTSLTSSQAASVSHTYPLGRFKVTLTVTDNAGRSSTYTELLSLTRPSSESRVLAQPVSQPVVTPSANAGTATAGIGLLDEVGSDLVPAIPEPQRPAAGAILYNGMDASFIWSSRASADLYDFRILNAAKEEVVRIGEFAARSICRGKRCRLRQEIDLEYAKKYTWHVRAHNRSGWSAWSSFAFSVLPKGMTKPKMPLILYPGPNAAVTSDETVTFLWEHHATAESYRFQLVNRESGEILVDSRAQQRLFCDPQQCAYPRPIKLPPGDRYAWQIQASNEVGESGWYRNAFSVDASEKTERPVASFKIVNSNASDMEIELQAQATSATGTIVNYEWSFGDGMGVTGTQEKRVKHKYTAGGSYFVTLDVLDDSGNKDSTQQLIHMGGGIAPKAKFLANDTERELTGAAPYTVTFDPSLSSGDTSLVQYSWDFGDGSKVLTNSEAAVVSHTYSVAGEFIVSLTVKDRNNLKSIQKRRITVRDSADALSVTQAGRFLKQATFGSNERDVRRLMEVGLQGWLAEQFELQGADHLEYVRQFSAAEGRAAHHEIWWQDVIRGKDQLRQRVAFALSQLFQVTDSEPASVNTGHALTALYDVLRKHAFGNYRDLLEAVTLNPAMALQTGMMLNSARQTSSIDAQSLASRSSFIDLKYAQLLLRDFTVGTHVVSIEGVESSTEAYPRAVVHEVARVLTGWNVGGLNEWADVTKLSDDTLLNSIEWEKPLQPFDEMHDRSAKTLLSGIATPPDLDARQDLDLLLDNLFTHPNVGPRVSKFLIQKLVTNHPSGAYVKRVASVFNDNGAGVRGDLKAVVQSILLDAEAREMPRTADTGLVKEPLMRLAHLWRAFRVQPGTASEIGEYSLAQTELVDLADITGQAVFDTPNAKLIKPGQVTSGGSSGDADVIASGFEFLTTDNARTVDALIQRQIYRHYSGTQHADDLQVAYIDFSAELDLAYNVKRLLNRLNTVLLAGTMSAELAQILQEHLSAIPDTPSGRLKRVQDAVSLIVSSPDYLVLI